MTNYCPVHDILGTDRPYGDLFDIGAYEWFPGVRIPENKHPQIETGIYPNPAIINATINYNLERSSSVKISLFDSFGRLVGMPVNGWQEQGEHKMVIQTENLPAGIYLYRIQAGNTSGSGKMVVVR